MSGKIYILNDKYGYASMNTYLKHFDLFLNC